MKKIFLASLLLAGLTAVGQNLQKISLNQAYPNIKMDAAELQYEVSLTQGSLYQFSVMQQGIDVVVVLQNDAKAQLVELDSPNGTNGLERFEYTALKTGKYFLAIKRLEEPGNAADGKITLTVKKFTKDEIRLREKIKKELEPENKKNVLTLDIDHFWEAFDQLKKCKTKADSVAVFQTTYLDRATNGLLDFIKARDYTAEKFVASVSKFPKFYNSVRKNTYEVKNAEPLIEEIFTQFKALYPNFKPFKVCFAIGLVNTGGTVSDQFVLIGTEVSTSTKEVDLSEFNNSAFGKVLANETNIVQQIKNIVAHECVHTQQNTPIDANAVSCGLLYKVMQEGFCDFIGELVVGSQINKVAKTYGDAHEKELWTELKNELCNQSNKNWLYNYFSTKDRPADLGYYMGYKIAESYYQNATDKKQAVIDIIEMSNPLQFLEKSKYDKKFANNGNN